MNYIDFALCYKALGDETRVKIFDMLKSGEKCACKLLDELNCSQPTLSYHMKMLSDCSLITTRKEGKWCYYSVDINILKELSKFILSTSNTKMEKCCEKD